MDESETQIVQQHIDPRFKVKLYRGRQPWGGYVETLEGTIVRTVIGE